MLDTVCGTFHQLRPVYAANSKTNGPRVDDIGASAKKSRNNAHYLRHRHCAFHHNYLGSDLTSGMEVAWSGLEVA